MKKDRNAWLDKLLADGSWDEVRKLRKGFKPNQGRLRNLNGELVSSEHRAETLAEYLERVQWAVRPIQPLQFNDHLGPELSVEAGTIMEEEVVAAGKLLTKTGQVARMAFHQNFGKQLLRRAHTLANGRLHYAGHVPESWHSALVVSIFKKGDTSQCENYRPISLLQIAYKFLLYFC